MLTGIPMKTHLLVVIVIPPEVAFVVCVVDLNHSCLDVFVVVSQSFRVLVPSIPSMKDIMVVTCSKISMVLLTWHTSVNLAMRLISVPRVIVLDLLNVALG
jgi:hypothetical protein